MTGDPTVEVETDGLAAPCGVAETGLAPVVSRGLEDATAGVPPASEMDRTDDGVGGLAVHAAAATPTDAAIANRQMRPSVRRVPERDIEDGECGSRVADAPRTSGIVDTRTSRLLLSRHRLALDT
jgi:hypothetical protein